MIPTLLGRLQSRLFLFLVIGVPITLIFALAQAGWSWNWQFMQYFLWFLATITGLGLLLDPVYIFLQSLRWDRDWPFAFQLFVSIVEFAIVLALARFGMVPWLPKEIFQADGAIGTASLHFALVLIPSYLSLIGPLSVFFIRWRFKGGEFGKL